MSYRAIHVIMAIILWVYVYRLTQQQENIFIKSQKKLNLLFFKYTDLWLLMYVEVYVELKKIV